MSEPWFQDGLRFECTRCGNCCTGAGGYVWLTDEELTTLAAFVEMPEYQFQAVYTKQVGKRRSLREKSNNDCVLWDSERGCTVYSARPAQCRTWPFWESTTETPDDWKKLQEGCPGAGKGQLFTVEEITARIREIRL